jgi:hypothetical protein
MGAELLREAAALMRDRADAAKLGPWESIPAGAWTGRVFADEDLVAKTGNDRADDHSNAEHIASWHPTVALCVADWLDDEAEWIDAGSTAEGPAFTLAYAYLGRDR